MANLFFESTLRSSFSKLLDFLDLIFECYGHHLNGHKRYRPIGLSNHRVFSPDFKLKFKKSQKFMLHIDFLLAVVRNQKTYEIGKLISLTYQFPRTLGCRTWWCSPCFLYQAVWSPATGRNHPFCIVSAYILPVGFQVVQRLLRSLSFLN